MNTLHDNADYEHSDQLADGVEGVFINGNPAVINGSYEKVCKGEVLRKCRN